MKDAPRLPKEWKDWEYVEGGKYFGGTIPIKNVGHNRCVVPGIEIRISSGPAGAHVCELEIGSLKMRLSEDEKFSCFENIMVRVQGIGTADEAINAACQHALHHGFVLPPEDEFKSGEEIELISPAIVYGKDGLQTAEVPVGTRGVLLSGAAFLPAGVFIANFHPHEGVLLSRRMFKRVGQRTEGGE